jgi:hypothetical protein
LASKRKAYDTTSTEGLRQTIQSLQEAVEALPAAHGETVRNLLLTMSDQYGELLGLDHRSNDIGWLACWVNRSSGAALKAGTPAKPPKKKAPAKKAPKKKSR